MRRRAFSPPLQPRPLLCNLIILSESCRSKHTLHSPPLTHPLYPPTNPTLPVNIFITVALGLYLQSSPNFFGDMAAATKAAGAAALERLDIGGRTDKMLRNPHVFALMFLLLLFCAPFCFESGSRNEFIGDMAAWPFVSLLFSGVLAGLAAYAYLFYWEVRGGRDLGDVGDLWGQ